MKCFNHPEREAVATCQKCGKGARHFFSPLTGITKSFSNGNQTINSQISRRKQRVLNLAAFANCPCKHGRLAHCSRE